MTPAERKKQQKAKSAAALALAALANKATEQAVKPAAGGRKKKGKRDDDDDEIGEIPMTRADQVTAAPELSAKALKKLNRKPPTDQEDSSLFTSLT